MPEKGIKIDPWQNQTMVHNMVTSNEKPKKQAFAQLYIDCCTERMGRNFVKKLLILHVSFISAEAIKVPKARELETTY